MSNRLPISLLFTVGLLGATAVAFQRIVGGHAMLSGNAPYHVAYLTDQLSYQCGGTILSPSYVMTAAHCIDENKGNGHVRAGSIVHDAGGQVVQVSEVIVHEDYSAFTEENDFAILKLASPLQFNDMVKAAKLPSSGMEIRNGKIVSVHGWGKTAEDGERSDVLLGIDLMKVGLEECVENFEETSHEITDKHICAIAPGKDSCQGDSGGGLIYRDTIVGVVSFGEGCARDGIPGVYADISKVLDWITGIISN